MTDKLPDPVEFRLDLHYPERYGQGLMTSSQPRGNPGTASLELLLALACATLHPKDNAEFGIRRMLAHNLDWTSFAEEALEQGLAGLAARTLERVAQELVSREIFEALRVKLEHMRQTNQALLTEVDKIINALDAAGFGAIAFRGPVFAHQIYRDAGLRLFRNLEFIVQETDAAPAIEALRKLGYERNQQLTGAQLNLIRDLDGQETVTKKVIGIHTRIYTRTTPRNMALRVDHAGLWQRKRHIALGSSEVMIPAPEDGLLLLAIHGGQRLFRRIIWVCDMAAHIESHPHLDWDAIVNRARSQGCFRMAILATALAHRCFNVSLPESIVAAGQNDRIIESLIARIMAGYLRSSVVGLPPGKTMFSMDHLRLHESVSSRTRYLVRTALLPASHHVMRIKLPDRFTTVPACVLSKMVQNLAILPMLRTVRALRSKSNRLRDTLVSHPVTFGITPIPSKMRGRLKQYHSARAEAVRMLDVNPNDATQWLSLANALFGLKRYREAIDCYDKIVTLMPDNRGVWRSRSNAIRAYKQMNRKFELVEEPKVAANDADSYARLAGFLAASQRHTEAAAVSDQALTIDPNHLIAMRIGIRCRLAACDWRRRAEDKQLISDALKADLDIITPFNHRMISDSEAENLIAAKLWTRRFARRKALWRGEVYRHDRIRIAYISAEFHEHAMTSAMAGVFEHHDKTHFQTIAISLGPDSSGKMRQRLKATFDRFIDVRTASDADIAEIIRDMEIDIALDLSGYSGAGRLGILAYRPAPVQVNCIEYPGTLGAPFIDYIIADRVVVPEHNQAYYLEKVVYLPNSYLPTDRTLPIAPDKPTRAEAGLPPTGFVFGCVNGEHKFSPETFSVWMRLLRNIEGSVLWLRSPEPAAISNLRREARTHGVSPERLIFAPPMRQPEHLARLQLADIFLDTLPCNAHASACDSLWAGVPVLTCIGSAFPGRVAASLLYAVGLAELVTSSLTEYEALALTLAKDRDLLSTIRARLNSNRATAPLFDTVQYTRNLEAAYLTMYDRYRRGAPPESFSIER